MSVAHRARLRPLISEAAIKKAQKAQERRAELLEELTKLPCPNCGKMTLALDDSFQGIVIYCERSICTWKPFTKPL